MVFPTPKADPRPSLPPTGTVNLWDLTRPVPVRRSITLPGAVAQIVFTPEGRHLATANWNGTIYLLRLAEVQP